MNKDARKKLEAISLKLEELKSEIEDLAAEERGKYENLSEVLQQSENGLKMSEAADALDSAASDLENVLNSVQEAEES